MLDKTTCSTTARGLKRQHRSNESRAITGPILPIPEAAGVYQSLRRPTGANAQPGVVLICLLGLLLGLVTIGFRPELHNAYAAKVVDLCIAECKSRKSVLSTGIFVANPPIANGDSPALFQAFPFAFRKLAISKPEFLFLHYPVPPVHAFG